MLNDILNQCIIEMKDVKELENVSDGTKRQAKADYNFKLFVTSIQKITLEVKMAVENSDFKPSDSVKRVLQSFCDEIEKTINSGMAKDASTTFLTNESKKTYTLLAEEWKEYYDRKATSIISMLDTVKGIATDKNKLQYAINKIKKGSGWDTDISNLQYMKNGLLEAKGIMDELALDDSIIQFLRLVSDGKATIDDLSQEILNWISKENLSGKLFVRFAE